MEGNASAAVEGRELTLETQRRVGEEGLCAMHADVGGVAVDGDAKDLVRRVAREVRDFDRCRVHFLTGWRTRRIVKRENATRTTTGIRFAEGDAAAVTTSGHEVRVRQGERLDAEVPHRY